MRKVSGGWTMPDEDARSMLRQIEERIRASNIEVRHRDALIRLRSIIEDDLEADRMIQQSPAPQRHAARR
jgi:hypothetical protein